MDHAVARLFFGAILGAGTLVIGSGCSKVSEASADGRAVSGASEPAKGSTALRDTPVGPSADAANYTVKISPEGGCHKAETCAFNVTLEAKGDYHINDKYPYKFKTQEPAAPGLRYPKPVVGRDDGKFEEKKAVLHVPFVSDTPGDKKVGGTLSLSVCSAQNCLMDKQTLETTVKVD
jgi:hypothetical protein